MAYKQIYIELSGRCNAKCTWCVTGIENRKYPDIMPSMKKNVMSIARFKQIINHLLKEKIADQNTAFNFYNWGEPFLNPDIIKIFYYMKEKNLDYNISTNASISLKNIEDEKLFFNLKSVIFSYCGFSQASYDRIHQFNFEKIKENTIQYINILRSHGFKGNMCMNYHVYQFNQGVAELMAAKYFCKELSISFIPIYAYINNFNQGLDYLENKLDSQTLKNMGKDLCFYYVDELLSKLPVNYDCPQLKYLVIDENGQLLPCCGTQDEILGNILECTALDIILKKNNIKACKRCLQLGLPYWTNNPLRYKNTKKDFIDQCNIPLADNKNYIIFGAGQDGTYIGEFLKTRGGVIKFFVDNNRTMGGLDNIEIKSSEGLLEKSDQDIIVVASTRYKEEMEEQLIQLGYLKEKDYCYFEDIVNQYFIENVSM